MKLDGYDDGGGGDDVDDDDDDVYDKICEINNTDHISGNNIESDSNTIGCNSDENNDDNDTNKLLSKTSTMAIIIITATADTTKITVTRKLILTILT